MAVRDIKKYPEPGLRKKTELVHEFDDDLQALIDDMIDTMYAAPGVGLAANQIGVFKQVTVIDTRSGDGKSSLIVLVNPQIVHTEGDCSAEEGCLSFPDYTTIVKRAERVKVKGRDRHGDFIELEAEGLLARALQHEIDHLNGIVLIDRIGRIKREFFRKRFAREHALSKK